MCMMMYVSIYVTHMQEIKAIKASQWIVLFDSTHTQLLYYYSSWKKIRNMSSWALEELYFFLSDFNCIVSPSFVVHFEPQHATSHIHIDGFYWSYLFIYIAHYRISNGISKSSWGKTSDSNLWVHIVDRKG